LIVHKRYNADFDHKLISQVTARLVGGIRAKATALIKPNHQPSGFRPSIPFLVTDLAGVKF